MITIHRVIFTMMFSNRADRDKFQTVAMNRADTVVANQGYTSRVLTGPDITQAGEKGYQWFDGDSLDAVWASRVIIGFTNKAECDDFAARVSAYFKANKDGSLAYWVDAASKIGSVTTDIIAIREAIDIVADNLV